MFMRKKIVKGKTYYYLVESYREGGKTKQRVIKYLGNFRPAIMSERNWDWTTCRWITRQILDVPDMEIEVKDGKLFLISESEAEEEGG